MRGLGTVTLLAGCLAALLAFSSAAVTAYWLLGETALLDTVGGALERLARNRSTGALMLASAVVVAKLCAGAFALALLRRPSRRMATVAAAAGSLLALYGAVLTIAGILVVTGVIESTAATNMHALRWHAVLWDPWFLVWGLALALAGITIRRTTPPGSGRRRRRRRLTRAANRDARRSGWRAMVFKLEAPHDAIADLPWWWFAPLAIGAPGTRSAKADGTSD